MNRICVLRAGLFVFLLAVLIMPAAAQPQVGLTLRPPPPNQLSLADLWQETVTYFSATGAAAQPITVWMVGVIWDQSQQRAPIVQAATSPFSLSGGTRVFTAQSINIAAPIQVTWTNQKVRDRLSADGQFPTGQYQVCVTIYMRTVNGGVQTLAQDCISQSVELTSPPLLIAPTAESNVELKYPIFIWTPPVPLPPRTRLQYVVRIVEIHGRQSAGSAMQTNPAWLEQPVSGSTTIQYPPAARELKPGQRYSWMVIASTPDGSPMGKSEVWEFTYQPEKAPVVRVTPGAIQAAGRLDVLEELLRSCSGNTVSLAPMPK